MIEAGRPSRGVVTRTLLTLRDHSSTSFVPAFLICIPVGIAGMSSALHPGIRTTIIEMLVSLVAGTIVYYSSTQAIRLYAEGTDPGVAGLLRRTFARGLGSFVATRLAIGLLLALAVTAGMLPLIAGVLRVGPHALTTGLPKAQLTSLESTFVLCAPFSMVLFVWAYLRVGLAGPANVLEGLRPTRSVVRSATILKGKKADFFVVLVSLLMVRFALSLILAGPGAVVSGTESGTPPPSTSSDPLAAFKELLGGQKPLDPARAAVVGVSSYLGSAGVTVVSASVLAEFFLVLAGPLPRKTTVQPDSESLEEKPD